MKTNLTRRVISTAAVMAFVTLALAAVATATNEYDCGEVIVCDTTGDATTCNYSADWGDLAAKALSHPNTDGVFTADLIASATPTGGGVLERWILTLCSTVSFRPYGIASVNANTYHCWQDGGVSHPYPCASTTSTWITNKAGSGSGTEFGSFCGYAICEGSKAGVPDHLVTGISINQPGNRAVDVRGDAVASYYEDRGAGCTLCEESRRGSQPAGAQVRFWIGSTPPL